VEDQVVGRLNKQLELMDNRRNMLWMVESTRSGSELFLCKQLMGFTPENGTKTATFWGNQLLNRLINRLETHITTLEDHLLTDLSECERVVREIEEGVFKVGGTD
jgi:hypothetical protein